MVSSKYHRNAEFNNGSVEELDGQRLQAWHRMMTEDVF